MDLLLIIMVFALPLHLRNDRQLRLQWPALLPAMVKMESDHSATVASGVHPALVVVHSTLVVVVDQVLAAYQDWVLAIGQALVAH